MQLASYQCHKVVKAGQITAVDATARTLAVAGTDLGARPELFSRYTPAVGDYLVEYEDGFQSVSPLLAFEAGYSLIHSAGA